MSFFNAIKKSFGFGSDDVDDGLLDDSADQPQNRLLQGASGDSPGRNDGGSSDVDIDPAMVHRIFDHVVETFNQALPGFLSEAVDPDTQRKKLYDGLDSSIKDYLGNLADRMRRQCETRWADEQISLRSEMENLKARTREIEQQRSDIKEQQLSADRQRRALNDRVHDLENQIAVFDAEREQLDLENKSLVNKLKVASVYEADVETLRNELNDAKAEIVALRNNAATDEATSADTLKERSTELEQENARLNGALEEAAEKDRIATEMLNGLQSKASAARSELGSRDEEIASLKARLAEAQTLKADIEQLNSQITMVEEVIDKRDRKIAKLKETCECLRNENASLRETIASNLRQHAETEDTLRSRIAELEADPTTPIVSSDLHDTPKKEEKAESNTDDTPKISDGDLAAIEESFDSADWMRSDPPITPSMRTGVSEAEFGYQAPVRKTPRQDNDAQLSLF